MRIALAQLNPTVGDIAGNVAKLIRLWQEAKREGADFVISSELVIAGYPLEDMVLRPSFINDVAEALDDLARETANGPGLLVGAPIISEGHLYNAAVLLSDGKVTGYAYKHALPNTGPFDECRTFASAPLGEPLLFRGHRLGVMICEDMWSPDVARHLSQKGAEVLIVLNGSPYQPDRVLERHAVARQRVLENKRALIYLNQTGGQDELLFDGSSFVLDAEGILVNQALSWIEDQIVTEWSEDNGLLTPISCAIEGALEGVAAQYRGIIVGLEDYVLKNGFKDVLIGLSGGIDSAVVAVMAVDALGADHVHCVMMPSLFTSVASLEDAKAVAKALGCDYSIISIHTTIEALTDSLSPLFKDKKPDLTEENMQSRSRGLMLMAMANKFNALLLSTGNKSELATGYATIYGDMCGAYAPIKDLYKTEIYKLARYAIDRNGPVIPERIFTKAPTAELRLDQTDQDNLPPYEILDDILYDLIEEDKSFDEIVIKGHKLEMVVDIWKMLQRSEYKRRQGPPGPRLSKRHLTKDRRYPITNRYKGS